MKFSLNSKSLNDVADFLVPLFELYIKEDIE